MYMTQHLKNPGHYTTGTPRNGAGHYIALIVSDRELVSAIIKTAPALRFCRVPEVPA